MSEGDDFLTVARVHDIPDNGQKTISIDGKSVLLCKSEGQYFAVQNRCTHDMEPLTGGTVRKCTIVCPIHGARFSLRNGAPFGPPAFESLAIYETRITGEAIQVSRYPKPAG